MRRRRDSLLPHVGTRLRELRQQARLTQEEVAERAGVTGKYISEIERGQRDPKISTLAAISADGLGISLPDFLSGGDVRPAKRPGEGRFPSDVERIAKRLSRLAPKRRRTVVEAVAALLGSARRQ